MTSSSLEQIRQNLQAASAAEVTVQGDPQDTTYVRALETVAGDAARLLAALTAVEEMAVQWRARGSHDMSYSKTIPDEAIAEAIHTSGAGMVENARRINNAIARSLEAPLSPAPGVRP